MCCPYEIGDKVYLKRIHISGFDNWLPTNLINKPLKIISISKIPLNSKFLWDIELEGIEFIVSSDDISKNKPF